MRKQPIVARTGSCSEFECLCRLKRRALLQAGCVSALGLGLPQLFAQRAASAESAAGPGFGRAKRCIFLFMWGGPSQLDTLDPKPGAPAEIRGEFRPISTETPGLQVSEYFRRLARVSDQVAVVRSLTHDDPAHLSSAHAALTGHLAPVPKSDAEPPSNRDTPHIGSVMARQRPAASVLPSFVTMPWKVFHPAAPGGQAPGQDGGWLGRQYDPLLVTGDPSRSDWKTPELTLLDGISTARLQHRQALLDALDVSRANLEYCANVTAMTEHQHRAFSLLGSPQIRRAFDIAQEPPNVRERYGMNIHGQCVLMARRLIEHGVRLVSVNWHNDGKYFWDTHGNNFNRLKDELIPPADQALAALVEDLHERGLLDETLIAWVGEFGRKPQITPGNAGREHWPFCYCGLLAGAGIHGGAVYGASDKHAAYPAEHPVAPQDFAATMYYALGVPADAALPDNLNRPHRICEGRAVCELFG